MKLIDVGKLLDELNERKIPYDVEINEIIVSQKVYEIEKVIEQLENVSKADRYDGMGGYVGKRTVYLDDAIEIVKQGGVSDDVCEWKQEDDNLITSCGDYFNILDNCTEKFDFCPKCGKKIKVVE